MDLSKTISMDELLKQVEGEERFSRWYEIDQSRIDGFADKTEDWQYIHVDPERAADTPFGGTIAHGFLTLSMLTHLTTSVKVEYTEAYAGIMMGVNYGFNKVRFPNPVKVGSKIRMVRSVAAAELKNPNTIELIHDCKVEIEGEPKPGCAAQWLTRLMYA